MQNSNTLLYSALFIAAVVTPLLADDECGPDQAGQDTITCNNATYTGGIRYDDSDGLTLNLDNAAMVVSTPGVFLHTATNSNGEVTINAVNFDTITGAGNSTHAIWAETANTASTVSTATSILGTGAGTINISSTNLRTAGVFARNRGLGDALTRMDGGEVNATGPISHGLMTSHVNTNATGSNTAEINGGTINSTRHGVFAANDGLGTSLAQMNGGEINTSADDGHGIYSEGINTNSAASTTVRMTATSGGGEITTTGDQSMGVLAAHSGTGTTLVTMSGGTITTSGSESVGVSSAIRNVNSTALASIVFSAGDVTTTGAEAHGLGALTFGSGNADISATGGTISAGGADAHGVFAQSVGGDTFITVNTEVTGGSGTGYAVRTETAAGQDSTIAIGSAADISSAAGLAIFNDEGESETTIAGGATVAGEIRLGDGSDTLDVELGTDITNITVMDGGDDTSGDDGWIDVLTLRNQNIADPQNAPTLINWEEVNIIDSTLAADGTTAGTVNAMNSSVTLGGTSAVTDLLGSTEDQAITVTDDTVIANVLEGAGGADTLSVTGNASVTGGVFGGGAGQDASGLADAADTITINTTGTVQVVESGAGADDIELLGGTITTDVLGQADDDTITLDGATVTGSIDGGAGIDQIDLSSGTVATNVLGGLEDDTITLDGATVTGNIDSGAGLDFVNLFSGAVNGDVLGQADDDTITLDGATVTGSIDGGVGADVIDLSDGSVTNVLGQDDDDTIMLDGATVTGNIEGGTGIDDIDLSGGTVETDVLGGLEDDTITLNGATVTGNIDGGVGIDTIDLLDGTVGTDVLGGTEVDTITLNGAIVNGSIDGGVGADVIDLFDGTVTDVLGAEDTDTITLDGAVVTSLIDGGAGEDAIDLLSGRVDTDVLGGTEVDTITLNGATVLGSIDGGAGADVIDLLDGIADFDVLGGLEADTITLNGATVTGSIDGGAGEDEFTWQSGTTAVFRGGEGSDIAEVTATEYNYSQILDGGDNDDETNGVIDQLTVRGLEIEISGTGNLTNWEIIIFDDMTVNSLDNLPATSTGAGNGLFLINETVFSSDDEFIHDGNLDISNDSEFRGAGSGQGTYQFENLVNNGTVSLRDLAAGDVMTTLGDYSGAGTLLLDVDFTSKSADTLEVNGDVMDSTTVITVQNVEDPLPASSAVTTSSFPVAKILLVNVTGTTAEEDFTLEGDFITNGAFDYFLELESSQWLLVPELNSVGAVAGAASSVLLNAFTDLPTMEQRTVSRQWLWTGAVSEDGQSADQGVWLRFSGDHMDATPESNAGAFDYESDVWSTQAGMEFRLSDDEQGQWLLGVTLQYGTVDAGVGNALGTGSVEADGYGAGLTATWVGHSGSYLDLQGQINWIESDFATSSEGTLIEAHSFTAHAISLEAGRRFAIKGNHSLIPQAQLSLGQIDGDRFTASSGTEIDPGANDSLTARLGLAYNYNLPDSEGQSLGNVYVIGNLLPTLSGTSKVRVGDTEIRTEYEPTWGEIGIGGSIAVRENARLYAEGSYKTALFDTVEDSEGYSFSVGMNINWL